LKTPDEHFRLYRDSIRNEILKLSTYYKHFKHLTDLTNTYLDELNQAPCFFKATMEAFFSSTILWAAKLLDTNSQKGIHNFVSFSMANTKIFTYSAINKTEVNDLMLKLSNLPSTSNIKTRRDKYHAHFDTKYFFDQSKLDIEAPILWGDFEEIISVLTDIYNYFSSRYDGMNTSMEYLNINDIDGLLSKVKSRHTS